MFKPADIEALDIDTQALERALDRTKSKAFLGKNSAFLGSLMCGLNFVWSEETPTAAVNGVTFWWNPRWFISLAKETRETVLMHELWHIAYMHIVRCGSRDPLIWNYATDIVINNGLDDEHYSFKGVEGCWLDHQYDGMTSEEIYDILIQQAKPKPETGAWGQPGGTEGELCDIFKGDEKDENKMVNNVVRAVQASKLAGQAGNLPGEIQETIDEFLRPKIDWRIQLNEFFTEFDKDDYSWKMPNRRYTDEYLPSRISDGRLRQLDYFLDVSGSVSNAEVVRFNSEVKHIKDVYNPEKLRLILFDHCIQKVYEFGENDPFEKVVIVGRGGTSLWPVREMILKDKPTAAVVFSDLLCTPMAKIPNFPIIWVSVNNRVAQVEFGKLIHIEE